MRGDQLFLGTEAVHERAAGTEQMEAEPAL
jgi:hypothetical protein